MLLVKIRKVRNFECILKCYVVVFSFKKVECVWIGYGIYVVEFKYKIWVYDSYYICIKILFIYSLVRYYEVSIGWIY